MSSKVKPEILPLVTGLSIAVLVLFGCSKTSDTSESKDEFAEVKTKLESFEKGEISLEELTDTGTGKADAEWVHSLVGYYLSNSNQVTTKMKLPISRCFGVMGKYRQALTLANDYINVYSNDWHGWRILGTASFNLDDFDAAVNAYTNALRLGDDANSGALAVAALKADRLEAFAMIVPNLVSLKDSPETEVGQRLEIAMLLVVYSLKTEQEQVFVKAINGLAVNDIR